MTDFLSCRNASTNMGPQRDFSNGARNSNTCLAEPGQATSKGPKICHTRGTPKGSMGVSKPYPWRRGQRPRAPGKMSASDCQIDAITVATSPAKPLPSGLGVKEEEAKPSVALSSPCPLIPDFLQSPMDQCRLRLNKQGELVPTNAKSPCSSPPATLGPEGPTDRSGPGGGWGAPLHLSYLTLRGNEGNWKSGSFGCHCFQPVPLPGNGVFIPQVPLQPLQS